MDTGGLDLEDESSEETDEDAAKRVMMDMGGLDLEDDSSEETDEDAAQRVMADMGGMDLDDDDSSDEGGPGLPPPGDMMVDDEMDYLRV